MAGIPSKTLRIAKVLSANDTGDTGAHQAGILIPKDRTILAFFPELSPAEKNPRRLLVFRDDAEERWEFAFIYYNNAFFGGTRNEFRLTRMTGYIKAHRLKPGDQVILTRTSEHRYHIGYKRRIPAVREADGTLKLGSNWIILPMERTERDA